MKTMMVFLAVFLATIAAANAQTTPVTAHFGDHTTASKVAKVMFGDFHKVTEITFTFGDGRIFRSRDINDDIWRHMPQGDYQVTLSQVSAPAAVPAAVATVATPVPSINPAPVPAIITATTPAADPLKGCAHYDYNAMWQQVCLDEPDISKNGQAANSKAKNEPAQNRQEATFLLGLLIGINLSVMFICLTNFFLTFKRRRYRTVPEILLAALRKADKKSAKKYVQRIIEDAQSRPQPKPPDKAGPVLPQRAHDFSNWDPKLFKKAIEHRLRAVVGIEVRLDSGWQANPEQECPPAMLVSCGKNNSAKVEDVLNRFREQNDANVVVVRCEPFLENTLQYFRVGCEHITNHHPKIKPQAAVVPITTELRSA